MGRYSLWVLLGIAACLTGAEPSRAPVLVELFTSEGCSSCPPADRLLEQLDPQVVVLSEHVDYWNHEGWRDPFSSTAFDDRQDAYRERLHGEAVYTPQMVVDGTVAFSGNDAQRVQQEIAKAAGQQKTRLRLTRTDGGVQVDVDKAPTSANVYLALADDNGASQVTAGENKGQNLHFVAIVRSIRKVGSVKRGGGFTGTVKLPDGAAAQRVVVFLQESDQGRVLGASMLPPGKS